MIKGNLAPGNWIRRHLVQISDVLKTKCPLEASLNKHLRDLGSDGMSRIECLVFPAEAVVGGAQKGLTARDRMLWATTLRWTDSSSFSYSFHTLSFFFLWLSLCINCFAQLNTYFHYYLFSTLCLRYFFNIRNLGILGFPLWIFLVFTFGFLSFPLHILNSACYSVYLSLFFSLCPNKAASRFCFFI